MIASTDFSRLARLGLALLATMAGASALAAEGLQRLPYNHPGLVVDLGVGLWAWPLPMDFDADGDMDLLVSCPDKPYNGVYFFENPGGGKFPAFKPAVRLGAAIGNAQLSVVDGQPRVLTPGAEVVGLTKANFGQQKKIYAEANIHENKVRANQWRYVDYDGDGALDLIVGVEDWTEYGWDNAYNERGEWQRGPLHGYVYLIRNRGTTAAPDYEPPRKIECASPAPNGQSAPVDTFGMPSPNFADFDADGDLDLLCGEFLDGFTYFENVGARTEPKYAAGRRLLHRGRAIAMDLQMITPAACDWDRDGDIDLVVGDEDGRVALVEHTGDVEGGLPQFLPPRYFQQQADELKFGALATPFGCDWDGDGDDDLISGNTAGYVGFLENLDDGNPPRWAAPKFLQAAGQTIRIQAGPNGSIQGPAEAKWGYTSPCVADWDHDGLPDLLLNSIWGKVIWFRNTGQSGPHAPREENVSRSETTTMARTAPELAEAQPIEVEWKGAPPKPAWTWWTPQPKELATQWRTTPCVLDFNGDGLNDLAMLDHEGYLALFPRAKVDGKLRLLPGARSFLEADGKPLRLNAGEAGKSGRRKLCFADWGADGLPDLLTDGANADFFRNLRAPQYPWAYQNEGRVDDRILAGHSTSPAVVDWDRNGRPDLVLGAEDGYFYYLKNPHP